MPSRWPQVIAGLAPLLLVTACATSQTGAPTATGSELDTHMHGFAMVHCLRSLEGKGVPETDTRVLREQGDRWGQVLVEHSRGDIFAAFDVLLPAIDAAIAATPMALVKVEETGGSATAPLFYCNDLLRQPAVMRAMAKARAHLAADYAGE